MRPAKFRATARAPGAALLALCMAVPVATASTAPVVGHRIAVELDPETGTLQATDRLTLPQGSTQVLFWLHEGLHPKVLDGDAILERIGHDAHLERFRLTAKTGRALIGYGGPIRHDMEQIREGMGRSRMQSIGTIGDEGVFLTGYSGWYPSIPDTLQHFDLTATVPPGWLAVSQGAGPEVSDENGAVEISWRESHPQDEIYLIAGRFKLYRQPTPFGEAQAYLRLPDDALAARYQAATEQYLRRYSTLLGDYPYAKFALVENFWETGYGMPSFTLLGSTVLRLPFILDSSYPHEILHNWWGNGVYVDYASGNWSEGLTAYLSDHLGQALQGRGADYRRDQLKAYADYVRAGQDFPLTAFRGRHGSASQAIGYGKMLMTMHMLRRQLGDRPFIDGLRRFYADNRFRIAGFADLQRAFEQQTEQDLGAFFESWTERTGAAELALADVAAEPLAQGGYRLTGRVRQVQQEPPFPLPVPVVIHTADGGAQSILIMLDGREAELAVTLPATPLRVAVDPAFETFRKLMPGESPVALSTLFGAERGLIVTPAAAPADMAQGYRALADAWQQGHPGWEVTSDDRLQSLPVDRAVWLLGWENRFLGSLAEAGTGFTLDPAARALTLEGQPRQGLSAVLTARHGDQPLGWVGAVEAPALPGLARKLPHYGKYGYLLFQGSAPDNVLKGQWAVGDSPLMVWLTAERPQLPIPPLPPLTEAIAAPTGPN